MSHSGSDGEYSREPDATCRNQPPRKCHIAVRDYDTDVISTLAPRALSCGKDHSVVITSTDFDTIQLSLESLIPVVLTSTLTWTLYLQVLFHVSSLVPFLTRIQNTSAIFGAGLFTVNGVPFESPSVPVLLQILSGTQKASDLLPKGSVYELAPNKSVELTIPGGASDSPVSVRESHYRYN